MRNDFIIVRLSHLRNPAKNLRIAELRLMRNPPLVVAGECSLFKKKYIMDEIDSLSEYIKIRLVTVVPMASFTPKSTSNLISALHFSYSIVIRRFYTRANTAQS